MGRSGRVGRGGENDTWYKIFKELVKISKSCKCIGNREKSSPS